jgi:hypothetical protein
MAHVVLFPANPIGEIYDLRIRYASVPISREQLELWGNYAAILRTLQRSDGNICNLVLWSDVTFYAECPVPDTHPEYAKAESLVLGGDEWLILPEDALVYEKAVRTEGDRVHIWGANFVFGGIDRYSATHYETDYVSIERLTADLAAKS